MTITTQYNVHVKIVWSAHSLRMAGLAIYGCKMQNREIRANRWKDKNGERGREINQTERTKMGTGEICMEKWQ